ncbi:hypothetical protein BDZ45DRAFT_379297 [Acephala macrosclerotiorum]|nr:hypothetical protein BDZ45DRAFT_379297 [Acephala macrosclerotiorum]
MSRKAARKMKNKAELQAIGPLANLFSPNTDRRVQVPDLHAQRLNVPSDQGHYSKKRDKVLIRHHEVVNASSSDGGLETRIQPPSKPADSQASPSLDRTSLVAVDSPAEANSPPKAAESTSLLSKRRQADIQAAVGLCLRAF